MGEVSGVSQKAIPYIKRQRTKHPSHDHIGQSGLRQKIKISRLRLRKKLTKNKEHH